MSSAQGKKSSIKAKNPKKNKKSSQKKKVWVEKRTDDQRVKVSPKPQPASRVVGLKTDITKASLVTGTNVLMIPTEMESFTLVYALATYMSQIYFRNVIGANDDTVGNNTVNTGLAYLGEAISTLALGGTYEISSIPRIFDVLTQLIQPRRLKFGTNWVNYTPTWSAPFSLPFTFNTGVGTAYTFTGATDSALIPMQNGPIPPLAQGYANFLKCHDTSGYTFGADLVVPLEKKGLFSNDPSAYARNYNYFGTSGLASGYYGECEIEMPFNYPYFSKFVKYNTDDLVVSRVFHPQTGGISAPIGLSLLGQITNYNTLKNPVPVQYKFIDFYQLYTVISGWVVQVLSSIPGNLQGNNITNFSHQFSFSATDFMFALRQAILTIFPEQIHGQFVAPVEGVPSSNNSVFQPFIVDSLMSTQSQFSRMMLPAFLVENLNMLKASSYGKTEVSRWGTVPTKIRHIFTPVWGTYSGDTPPIFQFLDADGVAIPLFNPVSVMPSANINDGVSTVNPVNKLNPNFFVGEIIDEWNEYMNIYCKRASVPLSPIAADCKVQVNLLPFTRVLRKTGTNPAPKLQKRRKNPMEEFISNSPQVSSSSQKDLKKKKEKVTDIPPASYYDLETETLLTHRSFTSEVDGALRFMLLPTIRLNYSSNDFLTLPAYQTVTGEIAQSSNVNGNGYVAADNEAMRLIAVSSLLASGVLAADSTNDTLTQAVKTLAEFGGGLDFLNSLFGGLASMIPVIGPALGGIIGGL